MMPMRQMALTVGVFIVSLAAAHGSSGAYERTKVAFSGPTTTLESHSLFRLVGHS